MKFRKRGDRTEVGQSFDLKNTFWIKAGKKINVYDYIQAASEDTDIYKTLEKYGSLEKIELDHKGVYGEFKEMDKMAFHEQIKKSQELWDSLPFKVRAEFNNDKLQFMANGEKWLKAKIQAETKKVETKQAETKKVETKQEEVTDEQK